MADIAIHTVNLTRDFNEVRAVDDLTMDVPSGIVFGFLGPNGSGKTTTINLLLGLLEPTAGKAEVLGLDTRSRADGIRNEAGALLEFSGLYERLSAADNLEFYGRVWKMPHPERKVRTRELLEHIGLWERRNEIVGKWSKGMRQKLAVTRALFHRPRLLFLDEPASGLDPVAAAALREDITSLAKREKTTVFLTTHNLAEAEKLCDRVGVISRGRLVALGRPDELRHRAGSPKVEITGRGFSDAMLAALRSRPEVAAVDLQGGLLMIDLRSDGSASGLIGEIVRSGGEIEEVHRGKASLEEAFLSLVEAEQ